MPYIHFTEEQKLRASEVDLVEFLRRQGEKLIPSGAEYRMSSDHSVTVRGNEWYDHAVKQGGGPISFVQQFYNLSYPEAVTRLLDGDHLSDGEQGVIYPAAPKQEEKPKEEFALPPANRDMRRVYAYLLNRRFLDRDVVSAFVRAGLLYESCEISKDKTREYHNAVFVGKDENGVPRHAHKRSVNDIGRTFRINVEGSAPRCSFHHTGSSDRLYVFEAPIDLLSFLTRYPRGWQEHSYVSLCGISEHAMLWMLKQNPGLRTVCLCLDHDAAGIEASGRLTEILHEHGYDEVGVIQPEHKDWNEELKARRGLPAQEAEEHPQLITASEICDRISRRVDRSRRDYWEQDIPNLIDYAKINLQWKQFDRAMECMEHASALALAVYERELRQLGERCSTEELADALYRRILPHQNRGSLQRRPAELTAQFQSVLEKALAPGIHSETEKRALADSWLELAVSFAKVPVKYEADILEQQQKQAIPQQEMG